MDMLWQVTARADGDAAALVASAVLDAYLRAREGTYALALSGGRIAARFFGELVRQSRGRRVSLADVDYFWCDERCVTPEHVDSNFRVARTELLVPLGVPERRIHRLRGEMTPEAGALEANREWALWGGARARWGGEARLDCAVLGVGEDGHVASLFPGNLEADLSDSAAYRSVRGPKPPPDRLTMGYGMLWEARWVVVLATGVGKAAVVRESLAGERDTPLARVVGGRVGRETWVVSGGGGD